MITTLFPSKKGVPLLSVLSADFPARYRGRSTKNAHLADQQRFPEHETRNEITPHPATVGVVLTY